MRGRRESQTLSQVVAALKRIFSYMRKDIPVIIIALIMAALGAVLTILGPNRVGDITNIMKDGLITGIDMNAILKVGLLMIGIYGSSAVFNYVQHVIMATVTIKTSKSLREALSVKINKVPMGYFNRTTQGNVLSRMTNDVQTLQQGMSNALPGLISSIAQFIGCIIVMFITEWRLSLAIIFVSLFGLVFLMVIMGVSQKHFVARQTALGELNGYIEEMYGGHEVVRISRAGKKVKEHFDELNSKVYEANWKSQFVSGVMQPVMNVVGNVGYVVVCVYGATLAISGKIEFGTIISFILYCRLFTQPLTQIAQGMTNLQTASASAHRVFDLLDEEELPSSQFEDIDGSKLRGAIEFNHVKFAYPDTPEKTIIKDFSAKVFPGQKVAIVGPTGAGKTTLVNLLMRFYDIQSGDITIDGKSTKEMNREDVHEIFSMVLQDTWLFEGTVRENLVYNMKDISDEDLERVSKACGISHFIHSLPEGFDTVLSEHTAISAGQKQLFTIARAMLQDAPMLILDEATSSVDTRTELIIQRAMDELMKNRTSFVIAHRLSTIKNADLILVLRDGDIVESGNHESLMAMDGFYASLYNSQFEN